MTSTIPPRFVTLALAAAAALALVAGGCKHDSKSDTTGVSRSVPTPSATPVDPNATRLTSGPAPLSFILGPGGPVRIVDTTTGQTVVTTTAPVQATITIDAAHGISIANQTVTPGPLPAGHRYDVWLDRR